MDTIGFFNYFSPYGNVSSDHLHAKSVMSAKVPSAESLTVSTE